MQESALELRQAIGGYTARYNLAFRPGNLTTANRTLAGHAKWFFCARALRLDYLQYLGNDIAALFDQHPVTNAHAQTFDLVGIMQSGASYGRTCEQYWFQVGNWC